MSMLNYPNDPIEDNWIELYSREPLSDEQIELLQIYLENRRMSNGGLMKTFEVSKSRRLFNVEFESYETKIRLLERKVAKFIILKNLNTKFKLFFSLTKKSILSLEI